MPTVCELVGLAQRGDMAAFQRLVERYQDRVLTVILGMWDDRAEAEELAQDVFVKAYRAIATFRGDADFSTWLYRIAVNRCQEHRRRVLRRRELAPQDLTPPHRFPEAAGSGTAGSPTAEDAVLDAQELVELRRQMDGLPEAYRLALYLHYFGGQPYKEMAQTLGISVKGVEARMARAREMLRKRMEEGGEPHEVRRGKTILAL